MQKCVFNVSSSEELKLYSFVQIVIMIFQNVWDAESVLTVPRSEESVLIVLKKHKTFRTNSFESRAVKNKTEKFNLNIALI